jgi:hypothetical protein
LGKSQRSFGHLKLFFGWCRRKKYNHHGELRIGVFLLLSQTRCLVKIVYLLLGCFHCRNGIVYLSITSMLVYAIDQCFDVAGPRIGWCQQEGKKKKKGARMYAGGSSHRMFK